MSGNETSGLPAALEERRRHALRDLAELAEQVEAGELDEATAERLRAGYEAELAAVEEGVSGSVPDPPREGRSTGRAIAGTFILIGALTVVILLAAQVFRSDDSPAPQAGSDGSALDAAALAEMEDVVAAHPDVPGMRLALADLYFEQLDYGSAVDHYLTVLSGEMTIQEESHALGRVGWIAYSTGQLDAAVDYLNASLSADPGYDEGKLFLGIVRLYGLEDAAGALPLLEEVRALPDLNDNIRLEVEAAIEDAQSVLETP